MSTISLTFDEMEGLLWTDPKYTVDPEYTSRTIKVIEETNWIHDHKSQLMEKIIEVDGKFYEVGFDRQGSYHTDWYYGFREFKQPFYVWPEVRRIEVVRHEWEKVND